MNKKIQLLDFKLKRNLWADIFWAYKSLFHGSWLEFAEHKEYVPWDEVKHIDWKLLWKTEKLFIKKYEEQRNINVLFILDLDPSFYQFKEKLELFEEVFYTLALSSVNNNDNISIYTTWKQLPYSYELEPIIKTIENIENKKIKEEKLEDILDKLSLVKNNLVFILTDNDKIQENKKWKLFALKNEVIYINIFDVFENKLDKLWQNMKFKNNSLLLDISLSSKDKIERYRQVRQAKLDKLEQNLLKNNISYLYLDTSLDAYKQIYKFFVNRK